MQVGRANGRVCALKDYLTIKDLPEHGFISLEQWHALVATSEDRLRLYARLDNAALAYVAKEVRSCAFNNTADNCSIAKGYEGLLVNTVVPLLLMRFQELQEKLEDTQSNAAFISALISSSFDECKDCGRRHLNGCSQSQCDLCGQPHSFEETCVEWLKKLNA